MNYRPIVVVVGALSLSACGASQQQDPQSPRQENPPPPVPKLDAPQAQPLPKSGSLNPKSADDRVIYKTGSGCVVRVPPPPGKIPPPGRVTTEAHPCPETMLTDPAWDECHHGTIMRKAVDDCSCFQTGNPPPPPKQVDCPAG